jgi:hypothetical protein
VYIETQKYGLPQAGIVANELVQHLLAQDGYRPNKHTHGLWIQDRRLITFSLVVDNFGIKYVGQEHAKHLKLSIVGQGVCIAASSWIGITKIDVLIYPCRATSRQPYTNSNIHHQYTLKMHHTHGAHPYVALKHNIEEHKDSPLPHQKDIIRIQELVGTLLYYMRAVDQTLVSPVNVLASEQTQATSATSDKVLVYRPFRPVFPQPRLLVHHKLRIT